MNSNLDDTMASPALDAALAKERALKDLLTSYGSLAVAYSGGVDSTYLAAVAHETLGARCMLMVADSPSMPRAELAEARHIAEERAWPLIVIETDEFADEAFVRNDGNRCYHCKAALFARMKQCAAERGLAVVAHGETAEDSNDPTRVGSVAAREAGAVAPLQQASLVKSEIRALSRRRGLPTWNKASFACLASRVPVGTRLAPVIVARIEQVEAALKELNFSQYRARHHGTVCRIEVDPAEIPRLAETAVRERLVRAAQEAGYRYVTMDLAGYRMGNMAQ